MTETEKAKSVPEPDELRAANSPLVFISHDARDAKLAEVFAKLISSVSAGMIKTFRSSDKRGTEGIPFGAEWYTWLLEMLKTTSDVVCLFTKRSIDKPWILYEAGVAKGQMDKPVIGLALGVAMSEVGRGPFYHFQNMPDSEDELTKLLRQLAKRVPGLDLHDEVLKVQVGAFRVSAAEILKKLATTEGEKEGKETPEESPVAKILEEMKTLPTRVAEQLGETQDSMFRRRRLRRFHPMMIEEMMHMAGGPGDPVGILMAASLIRDDAPWLYELAMEVYRAVKSGDSAAIETELGRLERFSEFMRHGPFAEDFSSSGSRESYMLLREFPRMLQHALTRLLEPRKPQARRRPTRSDPDDSKL